MINILQTAIIGVILNILVSYILGPFASPEEVKPSPPEGASGLSYKGQFMHMFVHHKQVMFTSSLIVFIVVFLSNFIQKFLKSKLII